MKILFFLPNLECGGAESVTVRVANHFFDIGHDVYFITSLSGGKLEKKLRDGINYSCLNSHLQWLSILPLKNKINEIEPDVCFSTMKESNFILIVSKALSKCKPNVVIREANTVSQQITAESRLHQKVKNYIISKSYARASGIICLSEAMKSDLQRCWNIDSNKIAIINNPIDFDLIESHRIKQNSIQDERGETNDIPIFCIVARLFRQKNHHFLFLALKSFKEKYGEFKVYIVGDGPLRNDLEVYVSEIGVSENVIFTGHTDNPYQFLFKSSVFILPSHFEGFSNALLEASACGLKVLVSDSQPTSVEFVNNYDIGCAYKYNDIDDFTTKLSELILSRSSQTADLSSFSTNDILDSYERYIIEGGI
ncbi:glycosyltransferase [Vibrio tetraodonis]|uniref:glycosyltransferase n=1 Tax=Vibrio tetraodonis TaxID=2231647 RepID=UPI000E0ABD6A|nr:glycosyltransferase [Vibrio tetraodonis]